MTPTDAMPPLPEPYEGSVRAIDPTRTYGDGMVRKGGPTKSNRLRALNLWRPPPRSET